MPLLSKLPPGPKTPYPGAHLVSLARDPIGFISSLPGHYGDLVYFPMAGKPTFLVNDPELIKEVFVNQYRNFIKGSGLIRLKAILGEGLITSEGDFHMRQRRLAQPAFHKQRIAAYGDVMSHHAQRARDRWQEGQVLDLELEMSRITMAIVGKTLLNADVEDESQEISDAVNAIRERFSIAVFPFMGLVDKLPLPHNLRFNKSKKRLDDIIYRMIGERRASGKDHGDLLSMLLMAQDTEGDHSGMTDLQVRDEAMTIFLAGYETITNTLTWTWYLLSEHPEVEKKLHEELDRVLEGSLPGMEDLMKMPYLHKVLTESMRLYPAAWMIARESVEECQIGGYTIPPGSVLFMCPYATHRNSKFYADPEKFDPDRWTPQFRETLPRMAYYTFGAGSRQCIGEAYAMMEGALLIAAIAQKWKLKMTPNHPVKIKANVTIRPKYGMPMKLESRK